MYLIFLIHLVIFDIFYKYKFKGKPLVEAVGEIRYSASFMEWFAGEARRTYGQIVPPPTLNRVHLHTREPIGVVVLITPVCG